MTTRSIAAATCAFALVLALVAPLGAREARAAQYDVSSMTTAQKEALVAQLIEILRTLLAARGITLDDTTLFGDSATETRADRDEEEDEDEDRDQEDRDEEESGEDEDDAQADAADAIESARDEIAEAREQAEHEANQAVALATLNAADWYLEMAEERYAAGDWVEAEARANQAEEKAWQAQDQF